MSARRCETRVGWQASCIGIDARKRTRSEVRAWARKRGIEPARQQAPRVRNRRPAWARDREANGPARTLHADEIRALGYATTKDEG